MIKIKSSTSIKGLKIVYCVLGLTSSGTIPAYVFMFCIPIQNTEGIIFYNPLN